MNQQRKDDINKNVELILKKYSKEEIGYLGLFLTTLIQEKEEELLFSDKENIRLMLSDPKENFFRGAENKFLSQIIYDKEGLKYFIAEMQKNIVRDLEDDKKIFTDEDIEMLRDFFTIESLKKCNPNKKNDRIKKLIISIYCSKEIRFEECGGMSGLICELLSQIVTNNDLEKAFKSIIEANEILYF